MGDAFHRLLHKRMARRSGLAIDSRGFIHGWLGSCHSEIPEQAMNDLPLEPPDETYECPFCAKQCGGENSYRQHVLSCHLNEYLEPEPETEDV